jgi:methyltransferase-like protein
MFYTLFEHTRYPLSIEDMVDKIAGRLDIEQKFEIKHVLQNELLKLIFSGHAKIYSEKPLHINEVSEKPAVSAYVRNQLKYITETPLWVTNQLHERVPMDQMVAHLLPLMDGSRTKEALLDAMLELPNLNVNQGDKIVTEPGEKKRLFSQLLDAAINKLKETAFLVA